MTQRNRRFPETWAQRADRLRALGSVWRIEAPYYARDARNRQTNTIDTHRFPPLDVTPYTFDEAVGLLEIFCQRYTENGQLPPSEVEPVAVEVNPDPVDRFGQPRRLASFTLKDVDERTSQWVERPARRPQVEEDEADRWLRERAA